MGGMRKVGALPAESLGGRGKPLVSHSSFFLSNTFAMRESLERNSRVSAKPVIVPPQSTLMDVRVGKHVLAV